MNLTPHQVKILTDLAEKQAEVRARGGDPDDACVYLSTRTAEPLSANWLVAQLVVDDELRPFYCITWWGLDEIGRLPSKTPSEMPTLRRTVVNLSPRDRNNIFVLHEFGVPMRVIARFYGLRPGSIHWLLKHGKAAADALREDGEA